MSELPAPADQTELAEPADHHTRDPHDRYRCYLGTKHTLVDRRVFWASQDREIAGYNALRKAEVRARRKFWRLIRRGVKAIEALRTAIGVDDGPIPELHTREEFDAIWTDANLQIIAARWAESYLTERCAAPPVSTAVSMLEDAAPDLAAVMITTARNPKARDADRIKSAERGLLMIGANLAAGKTAPAVSPIRITGKETAEELEDMLLRVAQVEPDVNRARLLSETIRAKLKALKPEVWGDKLELNGTGSLGLAGVLVEMQIAREAALRAPRITPAIEVRGEVVTAEDDRE